jgi:hypothetical protein
MKRFKYLLFLLFSSHSFAIPITYSFVGQTQTIFNNAGSTFSPSDIVVGSDSRLILNGESQVFGTITYDPEALRSGAGGAGLSDVLQWSLSTEGRHYSGGGNFHHLNYDENSFLYSDELPFGGFGPDVVNLSFNFDTGLFTDGPNDFLTDHFIDGLFSINLEWAHTSDGVLISGLAGSITKLNRVPESPPLSLLSCVLLASLFRCLLNRKNSKAHGVTIH